MYFHYFVNISPWKIERPFIFHEAEHLMLCLVNVVQIQSYSVGDNENSRRLPNALDGTLCTKHLNGLNGTKRFENQMECFGEGTKRFENETKRFGNGTKRFENGTLLRCSSTV